MSKPLGTGTNPNNIVTHCDCDTCKGESSTPSSVPTLTGNEVPDPEICTDQHGHPDRCECRWRDPNWVIQPDKSGEFPWERLRQLETVARKMYGWAAYGEESDPWYFSPEQAPEWEADKSEAARVLALLPEKR